MPPARTQPQNSKCFLNGGSVGTAHSPALGTGLPFTFEENTLEI